MTTLHHRSSIESFIHLNIPSIDPDETTRIEGDAAEIRKGVRRVEPVLRLEVAIAQLLLKLHCQLGQLGQIQRQ